MAAQRGDAVVLGYRAQPSYPQDPVEMLFAYAYPDEARRVTRHSHYTLAIGNPADQGVTAAMARPRAADGEVRNPLAMREAVSLPGRLLWVSAAKADQRGRAVWSVLAGLALGGTVPWITAYPRDRRLRNPWTVLVPTTDPGRAPWGTATPVNRGKANPWTLTRAVHRGAAARWNQSRPGQWDSYHPWGPVRRAATPLPDQPPDGEHGTVLVPIRKVYLVRNAFSLIRVDDGTPVDALAFSASLDAEAWTWSWSASVPGAQFARVLSTVLEEPVEVLVSLNGTPLRLVVESLTRERRFGQSTIRLSGRGRAAWLAAPYSPVLTVSSDQALTAQQCAQLALQENGVSIGWVIDWRLEDWLVAAGAWSHTGTHLEAVARVAEAGGGYVQPHDTDQVLRILPWYPAAPWDWAAATPDLALPEDVVTLEGIEWVSKPAYEAVYVAGSAAGGRLDRIRRAGTAGTVQAQTIVDPLATDPVMTRQRGLRVLADTGRQARLSLRLPMLEETGIVRPGVLVAYTESGTERRGLCRGVSLSWAFPEAWQTLEVETHE